MRIVASGNLVYINSNKATKNAFKVFGKRRMLSVELCLLVALKRGASAEAFRSVDSWVRWPRPTVYGKNQYLGRL